jgi:hypothetical protein
VKRAATRERIYASRAPIAKGVWCKGRNAAAGPASDGITITCGCTAWWRRMLLVERRLCSPSPSHPGTGAQSRGAESQGEVRLDHLAAPLPVRWHSQKESPSGSVLICAVGHLNPIERLYRCSIITFTITMRGLTTFCTSSSTTLCHCVFANVLLGARRPPCKLCDSQAKTHPRQTVRRCNLCNQRNSSVSYVRSAFTHSMLTSQCCILRLNQSHERIGPPSREKFICRYKHEAADADGS